MGDDKCNTSVSMTLQKNYFIGETRIRITSRQKREFKEEKRGGGGVVIVITRGLRENDLLLGPRTTCPGLGIEL